MIKVSFIIACGLLATALLRRRPAALRHFVLVAAICCAGATPLFEQIVPSWQVPLHPSWFGRTIEPLTLMIPVHATDPLEDLRAPAPPISGFGWRLGAQQVLVRLWLAGALGSLSLLLIGLARIARLQARSHDMPRGRWTDMAEQLAKAYGIHRAVALLESAHPTLLATWGVRRPTILLPASAREWSDDRVRIVLGHELAHIRRHDWLTRMAAEALRCVYWFDPLVWIACWRLQLESEQACDDAVLGLGIEGTEYATALLDLARTFRQSRIAWFPAPAMARRSSLERRIRAMLNNKLDRAPITRLAALAAAIALVAVTVPLAGMVASAQATTASFSGVLVDAVGRIMPVTILSLTNVQTKAKHEATSDSTAHFTFTGLPAGDYLLGASRPGFATSQGRVTLDAGQSLVRDVVLQVGDLQETINIHGSAASSQARAAAPPQSLKTPSQAGLDACTPPAVGGEIVPPLKLADKKPVYPPQQQAAGMGAVVQVDARIGTDGLTKDFRLAAPADPDFANAVINAVGQWQFSQTKLDCVPVEVTMHVTARFSVE